MSKVRQVVDAMIKFICLFFMGWLIMMLAVECIFGDNTQDNGKDI